MGACAGAARLVWQRTLDGPLRAAAQRHVRGAVDALPVPAPTAYHRRRHWGGCIITTQKTGLDGGRHIAIGEFQSVIMVRTTAIAAGAAAAAWMVL
eukprot:COSAG01_NODE_6166_length_3814_cov_46.365276_3_plen_96_part_00